MTVCERVEMVKIAGFQVLTAVVRKTSIVWDITPCSPLKVNRCSCFHAGFLLGLFFDRENGSDVPPKRRLTLSGLHGVISQKIELFRLKTVCGSVPGSQGIRASRTFREFRVLTSFRADCGEPGCFVPARHTGTSSSVTSEMHEIWGSCFLLTATVLLTQAIKHKSEVRLYTYVYMYIYQMGH
jgi:hypothetical protein